jgi:hypothetical protein
LWLTFVIGEVVLHWTDRELLLKAIDLVKEKDYARLHKPPRVADAVEKSESFLHTVDSLILKKQLVIFRDGDQEEDGRDIFEAVNPLFPLRPLSAHVEHSVGQVLNNERRFCDTSGLDTGSEDVLIIG